MSRVNNDLKEILWIYMKDIINDWVSSYTVTVNVDGNSLSYDNLVVSWKNEGKGKVLLNVVLEDTSSLDKQILYGFKVGSYEYYDDVGVEIEGGYVYNNWLLICVDEIDEVDYSP